MVDNTHPALSETAQLVLGGFAMADSHTLAPADVDTMSRGVVTADAASVAMDELVSAGLAERVGTPGYRLTRAGLEISLALQSALTQRPGS